MPSRPSRPRSKRELDHELELARVTGRYTVLHQLVRVGYLLGVAACLAALWLPAHALAGRKTFLSFSFVFDVSVALSASAGIVALYVRSRRQARSLERMRERLYELERGTPADSLEPRDLEEETT